MLVEKQFELEQRLGVPLKAIAMFCRRWNIVEFAVFGSIQMKEELQKIVNRRVDFIVKKALKRSENWRRREKILASANWES